MKTEKYQSFQELEYSGKLIDKQFPTKSFVKYEELSMTQNELYKRCLIGLEFYSPQELYFMNSAKKAKIAKRHRVVQENLNLWKQELTNRKTNTLLGELFPKASFIRALISDNSTSNKFINTLSFKELGITKEQVIQRLIDFRFLPANFAAL